VDYFPTPSSTTFIYQAGEPYNFDSTAEFVADAQLWLDQPGTNFGWMLIVLNETENFTARRFGSRESGSDAPRLSISYQPPPTFTKISAANDFLLLEYVSPPGFAHQVQFTDDLQSGHWQSFPPIGPYPNATTIVFSPPMLGAQGFYRLKVY